MITATEIAERAIGGLKLTVRDVNENLNAQLTAAGAISIQLKKQLAEGDMVVRRLSKIASAARPSSSSGARAGTHGLERQGDRPGGAGVLRAQKV